MNDEIKEIFFSELEIFRKELSLVIGKDIKRGDIEDAIKNDVSEIFTTKPLLTLKGRNQLGLVHLVKQDWENVTHTRFEHSIGVTAKCIVVCDLLNEKTVDPTLRLSKRDVLELALASALHDCGHLPISHAVERAFLGSGFDKDDVEHEARIIPLLIRTNPYFDDLHNIISKWQDFNEHSIYRVAYIISPSKTKKFVEDIDDFIYPKRAVVQLLSSEIDMDRLDYIIRDAEKLNYYPVKLLRLDIISYIQGLSLKKTFTIGQKIVNNVELYLSSEQLHNVFNLLVGRVLLYKYCYFSKEVRSFEAILTYLIGHLLKTNISIDPLKLIAMSDDYFIQTYLDELVENIIEAKDQNDIRTKYVNVLKEEKVERFIFQFSIFKENIKNPRLREELSNNIHRHSYIDLIKDQIIIISKGNGATKNHIQKNEILLDVFNLKTGGGDLLVFDVDNKIDKTLKDFMNGSNMHRLCSETRLDIYYKSDLSDIKKRKFNQTIKTFFEYEK